MFGSKRKEADLSRLESNGRKGKVRMHETEIRIRKMNTLQQHAGRGKGVNGRAGGFDHIEMGVKPQGTSGEMMRMSDQC